MFRHNVDARGELVSEDNEPASAGELVKKKRSNFFLPLEDFANVIKTGH